MPATCCGRTCPTYTLYDVAALRTIFIEFENPAWEKELESFYRTDVAVYFGEASKPFQVQQVGGADAGGR